MWNTTVAHATIVSLLLFFCSPGHLSPKTLYGISQLNISTDFQKGTQIHMNKTTRTSLLNNTESVSYLLMRFAPPAIISNLTAALYNMADQVFIGQGIGYLGNSATNVAFPLTTICMCIAMMIGVGSASVFNISLGKKQYDKCHTVCGTSLSVLLITGIFLFLIIKLFLSPILYFFGATPENYTYAATYVSITAWGIPFLLFSTGGNQMIRADGSPMWSMICMVTGAVLNVILDPLFIFHYHLGIAGAAWATVLSQIISALLVLLYLPHFQTADLKYKDFIPDFAILKEACSLGLTAMFNNLTNFLVQVVLNNLLRRYGAVSPYGSDIPLAAAGITIKLNTLFTSLILGIAQGSQPVNGFNIGAKRYAKVRSMYRLETKVCAVIGIIVFLIFQIFTTPIILLFGKSNALYMEFAGKYLHIFFLFPMLTGIQTITTMFCSQIGNAKKGAILALTKQVGLMIPLLCICAYIGGVTRICLAVPATELLAFIITMAAIHQEFQHMPI